MLLDVTKDETFLKWGSSFTMRDLFQTSVCELAPLTVFPLNLHFDRKNEGVDVGV